jgi:predicted phage tail protein
MRSIKVYGSLAKFLGKRTFKAAVNSPAEAIRFLLANFPGLRAHMQDQQYKVGVGSAELEIGTHPEHLHFPTSAAEQIRIIPVIAGAGAVGRIIAGVALIALASVVSFGTLTIGATAIALNSVVFGIGASLVLGGVAQLLTPTQKMSSGDDSFNDPRKSYSFSGVQNVSRQGVPVNIVFGECLVGSIVISAGINTEEA